MLIDWQGWMYRLRAGTETELLLQCLIFNALVAVVAALMASLVVAKRQRRPWRANDWLFLSLLGSAVPGIGPVLLLPLTYPFSLLGHGKPDPIPSLLDTPEYIPEITAASARFSAGGVIQRLRNGDRHSAIQALMALYHQTRPGYARILRELLRHRDDELRLLAFSILDRREKLILEIVHRIHTHLDHAPHAEHLGLFQKELALLHWELVHLAVGQEDLQQFHVEQATFHLHLALELIPEDPGLQILRARLALWQNRLDAAESALREAQRAPVPPSRTIPYLAELAFRRRHFEETATELAKAPVLRWLPAMKPIVRLWLP